jgi:hypothetical protein
VGRGRPGECRHGGAAELGPDGGRGSAGGQPVPAGGGGGGPAGAGGAGGAPLPQGRRHRVVPGGVRAAVRAVRVRGGPGRPAGDGVVRGGGGRRVPGGRAGRPVPGHRMAGLPAVVDRGGRDVRDQLLGVQLAAGRGRAAACPQGGRRHLRQRRPLHRRRALHRWGGQAARPGRLPALHGRPERAAAGPGDRRGGLAGTVAGAGRWAGAVAAAVAGGAGRRALLAAGVAAAGLRADRLPHDAGGRVGRRLPQRHLQGPRAAAGAVPAAVRALEPHGHRPLPARAADRPGPRDGPLVGPLAAGRSQRRRPGAAGDRVRPPRHPPGPRP